MKDKTSIISAAQKYTSKGQIDKAIAEWNKLLEDHKDGNVQNTVGDLYLRKGAEQDAIDAFRKAAEIFKKDGFYPKAIAVFKKVLNLSPNDTDALIALAKLNGDRGLMGDAIEHYYRAAEIFNRDGNTEKATTVVERMLQLSPKDVGTRSKIAYLYFRIGHRKRAASEYSSIADDLLNKEELDKAQEFFEKALEYDPENVPGLLGRARLAELTDNLDEAHRFMGNALALDQENKEVMFAYAELAMKCKKIEDAKKLLIQFGESSPDDVDVKRLLGRLYLQEGKTDQAWDTLVPVIDGMFGEGDTGSVNELLEYFREVQSIPVKERILKACRVGDNSVETCTALKDLALLHENEGEDEQVLSLLREYDALAPGDEFITGKIKETEIKLGITQTAEETVQEEASGSGAIDQAFPEHNEVSLRDIEGDVGDQGIEESSGMKINLDGEFDYVQIDEEVKADSIEENSLPADKTTPEQAGMKIDLGGEFDYAQIDEEVKADLIEENSLPADKTTPEQAGMKIDLGGEFDYAQIDEEVKADSIEENSLPANKTTSEQAGMKIELGDDFDLSVSEVPVDTPDPSEQAGSALEGLPDIESLTSEKVLEAKSEEPKPLPKVSADDDLQALFAQFGGETEKEVVDYEAHYESGLEFKRKGMLDEAIKEMEIASADPEKKQRNTTMLALCYMEKGEFLSAIKEFGKLLESMSPEDSMYLHAQYELAKAHVKNKDSSRALELFAEIQSKDPDFKDVTSQVESLRAQSFSVPDDKPKTKKNRVSYI